MLPMALHGDGPYTIAYAGFGPVNTGVFIANADGSGERVLLGNPALDSNPSFSPDGRWVLFTSSRNGSADIYRIQTDGSYLERLTDDPSFDDQAVMSPDGRHVAFVSSRTGQADIWVLDLRTRRLRNLTNDPGGDYRPAWSRDGGWIAFTTDRDSAGAIASHGCRLRPSAADPDLHHARGWFWRAAPHERRDPVGGASWSPDGKAIAFYEAPTEDWQVLSRTFPGVVVQSQIGSVEVATGVKTMLTTGSGTQADAAMDRGGTHRLRPRRHRGGARATAEETSQLLVRRYSVHGRRCRASGRVHECALVCGRHEDGLPPRRRRDVSALHQSIQPRPRVPARANWILPFVFA